MSDPIHPEIIMDVDIQGENYKKQKNMLKRYNKILQSFRGQTFCATLFDDITNKIAKLQHYYDTYGFPPSCCVITFYGVAIDEISVKKVILAQKVIKSPEYQEDDQKYAQKSEKYGDKK